ncbi:MAG: DNA mismatch repair endonuclease MutL [Flavobacteriales bacterium]|nr:DNA mismatch repair endonuclease MutL [Flavobacteriales bacterium]
MPDLIRLLPESIANQIAAGEVVQRPASVVKELLENSLDAGATSVKLIFKDGGQTLIQVIDNGKGMTETDARMCWERHATSKIKKADDLFNLSTFGFRGEALASIAAVAQVEMKTKQPTSDLGTQIIIEASEVKSQQPANTPVGTSIAVKNLFFNIPVRRNFLKSISVETKYIIEEFQRVALSRPDVEMHLFNGQNEVYKLAATNLNNRIEDVLLKSSRGQLIEVNEITEIVSIKGVVGSPELAKKTRGNQFMFANQRYIKEPYFHHAIATAFDGLIEKDFHPFYVLFFEVNPSKIDVNVHPTKTEVKFEDGRSMYQIILSVMKKALAGYNLSPALKSDGFIPDFERAYRPENRPLTPPTIKTNSGYNPFGNETKTKKKSETHWEKLFEPFRDEPLQREIEPLKTKQIEFAPHKNRVEIGATFQYLLKYIVGLINNELYVINQQKAHERILYETYLNRFRQRAAASQQLLFPRTIEFHPADFQIISGLIDEINQLGFDISQFGKNTLIINGTPAEVVKGEEQEMLEGILENYKLNQQNLKLEKHENLSRAMARNAGIKAGNMLEPELIKQLIVDLFHCENPGFTPSGDAVFVKIDQNQIANFFV